MMRADRTATALYMRGTDPAHHIHVTEKGEPKFVGLCLLRGERGRPQAPRQGAGRVGGRRRSTSPAAASACGSPSRTATRSRSCTASQPLPPIATKRQKLNTGEEPLSRAGELMRLPKGPSHVKRIGHGVLMTPKFHETVGWFRDMLGFICSDDVYAGEKNNLIGSFNRCDRGDAYVDHHVFFCLNHDKTGLNHLSFEVPDIDDVAMGHDYLAQFGKYEHMWGIGRHVLGSQVYDYWADPWGRVHEHWADSDRLNLANGSNLVAAEEALTSQWGEAPPAKFIDHASP